MDTLVTQKVKGLTGNDAGAEAMRQINPDVVAAYPITPQTELMHAFAAYVAGGKVNTEFVTVESEHSAMSATIGASVAGARAMTATSSQGLALMWEVVYIAASLRLPIVMVVVNRALSAPINIHCDHSDSMGCRDSGWIQLYAENAQEVYDNIIQAVRIAEHPEIRLPVMVCMDGFIISHSLENVKIIDDKAVKEFVGEYKPPWSLLDTSHPVTVGPLDLQDYYFEHKRQQAEAMLKVPSVVKQVGEEFGEKFGRSYSFFDTYKLDDAEVGVLALGSTAGTIRVVIDDLRKEGIKIGLLKLRMFRPFPVRELADAVKHLRVLGVMDRCISFGAQGGPVFMEVRSALCDLAEKPITRSYIYGLGGRDITKEELQSLGRELNKLTKEEAQKEIVKYFGVRGDD